MSPVQTFLLSIICFFSILYFKITNIGIIAGIIVLILAISIIPIIRVLLFDTNINRIETFLLRNKKNSNFYMVYALANGLDDEIQDHTSRLVNKTKQRSRQALYKISEAIHFKDWETAKEELQHIKNPDYKRYYEGYLFIEEETFEQAEKIIESIQTPWMKNALLAEREKKMERFEEAAHYAKKAKDQTKGLQFYSLHKLYEREFQL